MKGESSTKASTKRFRIPSSCDPRCARRRFHQTQCLCGFRDFAGSVSGPVEGGPLGRNPNEHSSMISKTQRCYSLPFRGQDVSVAPEQQRVSRHLGEAAGQPRRHRYPPRPHSSPGDPVNQEQQVESAVRGSSAKTRRPRWRAKPWKGPLPSIASTPSAMT
jgi:hypothetical protein